ncbi:TPA: exodeoxyribonuclease III [Candidatus Sumerlaeota bacterium]|jgi:exodeoxyribonuclease III|nr:exodeoxyribonuclease III [Candidatus Sumerlaeota bacterium]
MTKKTADKKSLRIVSWNVNGIRAILQKNFLDFVAQDSPDILCLQETKAHPGQVNLELPGYHLYWNSAKRPGYSGVAVFSRIEPQSVTLGIGIEKHDQEGRVLTLDFGTFYLVNVYTPNSGQELARLRYRSEEWDSDFLNYLCKLQETKPVVFCGDLNVAHQEIDLARPDSNHQNAGFTDQERAGFSNIVARGFVDTFRALYPDKTDAYSWWSYRMKARERNVGWRIDYFCVSPALGARVKKAEILSDVLGSDHCPVAVELENLC